jgi:hypothetical protein
MSLHHLLQVRIKEHREKGHIEQAQRLEDALACIDRRSHTCTP